MLGAQNRLAGVCRFSSRAEDEIRQVDSQAIHTGSGRRSHTRSGRLTANAGCVASSRFRPATPRGRPKRRLLVKRCKPGIIGANKDAFEDGCPVTHFLSSLRFRLLVLVLLALVPASTLIIRTAETQRQAAAANAMDNALRLMRAAAGSQEQLIAATQQLLMVLAQLPAVRDREPAECSQALANLVARFPHYTNIAVSEPDGHTVCSALGPKATDVLSMRPTTAIGRVFYRALDIGDIAVGRYATGPFTGKGVLAFGYPILDPGGRAQAVIIATLNVASLNELAAQSLLPPGSTLTAVDSSGTIVARFPDPDRWVGTTFTNEPIYRVMLEHRKEGTAEAMGADGSLRLYAYTPLQGLLDGEPYIAVGIPLDTAFAEANQVQQHNLLALGLVALLTIGAAWIGGDWFLVRQVRALVHVTDRLVQGDLAARTGLRHGTGEVGQLTRAFDRMAEGMELREQARRQAEDQVRGWSKRLGNLMNVVSESISQPLGVKHLTDIALHQTMAVMNLTFGCVMIRREGKWELVAQAGSDMGRAMFPQTWEAESPATQELARWALAGVVQTFSDEAFAGVLDCFPSGQQSWIIVPIQSRGRTLGILCLGCSSSRVLESHEQEVLAAVGRQVGVALENIELYDQVQTMAVLKERERLGRELHDGLAQVLGYLYGRNKVATNLLDAGDLAMARAQMQEMQDAMQEAYQDVRESILGLRVTLSQQDGLVSALDEYVHKFSMQTGIHVVLGTSPAGRIECSPGAEVQLLRIIQEALANVRKHSEAKQARIRMELKENELTVTIEDDGKGFDLTAANQDSHSHFGLQTMRERAEGAGGHFDVWSEPGQGTRITVNIGANTGGA